MAGRILKSRLVHLGVSTLGTLFISAAISVASAGAAQITVGNTSGTPSANICAATIKCTYLPLNLNPSTPYLVVPSSGTITSFSVNAGSAGGTVWLRLIHFYHGSIQYVSTSPPQTLALGLNTFNISMAAQAGDQLALDNDSSALMFDTSNPGPSITYFQPALASTFSSSPTPTGTRSGYRLLLSATLQSNGTPTPTSSPAPPSITNISQSHRRWRVGGTVARFASAARPPVGTTFRFTLSGPAIVRFAFAQLLPGRRVNGKCVAQSSANRNRRACTRLVARGALSKSASAGAHKLIFQGRLSRTRKLQPGTYTLTITATNTAGLSASRTLRTFKIIPG
jgi:hypothetical protein